MYQPRVEWTFVKEIEEWDTKALADTTASTRNIEDEQEALEKKEK